MTLVRLQKLISHYGYTSRRKAEALIKEGKVRVNGVVENELGVKVPGHSLIEVEGKIINKIIPQVYLMLNKPAGYLCSKNDPFNRKNIYDLFNDKYKNTGIFSVGRLDYMSDGLLLVTNDGYFSNTISHPSSGILKKYEVTTDKNILNKSIAVWKNGIYIKGIKYTIKDFLKITLKKVIITLGEGKNKEIRRLFKHINLDVVKLKRIAIGPLELGDLPVGKYRELLEEEVKKLLQNS